MKLSAGASAFVPGVISHCPCSRDGYLQKVLETLSTPGGTPSSTFDVKFKADHGLPWTPEWAGVAKLEELISPEHGVSRWADSGNLVYGSKEVLVQRVFGEQLPPAPLCTIKGNQLSLVPIMSFSYDNYEIHKDVKKELLTAPLKGMKVRVKCTGKPDQEYFLDNLPWVVIDLPRWFHYEISVQYYLHNSLTGVSKSFVHEVDVNQIWDFENWDQEQKWMSCYFCYRKGIKKNFMRKKVKKYIDLRTWKNNLRKSKQCTTDGFHVDSVAPARLTAIKEEAISRTLREFWPAPKWDQKILKLIAAYSECVMAVHVLLTSKDNSKRLVVMKGFSKEVKHKSELK